MTFKVFWARNSMVYEMGWRKIIHVDKDAFYGSVEQRDDPELRGKPVIVAWNLAAGIRRSEQRQTACAIYHDF